MTRNLSGKIIIVTGASEGIGRAIAEKLGKEQATVVVTARRKNLLEEVAEKIQTSGGKALVVPADLCETSNIAEIASRTRKEFGRIDVLINVAGMGFYDWIEENTAEEIIVQYRTNVIGMLELIRQVVPTMKKQKYGHIINFSSYASQVAVPPLTIYSSTKYAIEGLTDALRRELSPWNIRLTRIHPSGVNTKFNERAARHGGIEYPFDPVTGVTKEQVAQRVIETIYHPRSAVFVARWKIYFDLVVLVNRYAPWIIDLVIHQRVKKMWKLDKKHDLQV